MPRLKTLKPRLSPKSVVLRKVVDRRNRTYQFQKVLKQVRERDEYLCQSCLRNDRVSPAYEVDHIVPLMAGGTDDPSNLECICKPCHRIKTLKDIGGG